jgi:hypothetical protein
VSESTVKSALVTCDIVSNNPNVTFGFPPTFGVMDRQELVRNAVAFLADPNVRFFLFCLSTLF